MNRSAEEHRRQKAAVPELRSPLETIQYVPCCSDPHLRPVLAVRVLHGDLTVPKGEDVAARDLRTTSTVRLTWWACSTACSRMGNASASRPVIAFGTGRLR